MLKSMRQAVDGILNYPRIVSVGTVLFFCIFGVAILLVVLNAKLIGDQMSRDFNQRQLILAQQTARAIEMALSQMQDDIETIDAIIAGGDGWPGHSNIAARISGNDTLWGLVDIGLLGPGSAVWSFLDTDGGGLLTPELLADLADRCDCDTLISKMQIVQARDGVGSRVTAIFAKRTTKPGDAGRILCGRIDITHLLSNILSGANSGKPGHGWIVNESGTFIYHPRDELVGRNAFVFRRQARPGAGHEDINTLMRNRMLEGHEGAGVYENDLLDRKEPTESLVAFAPVNNRLMPGRFWAVAMEAPISEIDRAARSIYINYIAAEFAIITGMFLFGLIATAYHRRVSNALKKRVSLQEEYISGILRSSEDAIIFIDNGNRIQVWNKGAELIFGYGAEEMLGKTFHKLIPPDIDADKELRQINKKVMCNGHIREYRATRITKGGRRIAVDLSGTAVYSETGDMVGSIVIIRDVTEKVDLDQRIYNAEKLASIGILAAGIAHEINNPLTAILGFTDLVKERLRPGTPEHNDILIIEDNANSAKRIVDNILGFARVSEGGSDTAYLPEVVEKVADVVRGSLVARGVGLTMEIPDRVPEVRGDPSEIQQVLFNLLNNSLAAIPDSGGQIIVKISLENDGVDISVTDTGTGIARKIQPLVFDPFFTTKKVGEGTGLGLSLCYGIVKKYGGRIGFTSCSAEDHPGAKTGSTFTVSLPVAGDNGERREKRHGTENIGA